MTQNDADEKHTKQCRNGNTKVTEEVKQGLAVVLHASVPIGVICG